MQQISFLKQRGAALIVSLLILLVMTLIGLSGMQTTVLEERMAGNFKNRNLAFQSAESALREGEEFLRTTPILPSFNGTTLGLYQPTTTGQPRWHDDNTDWSSGALPDGVITYGGALAEVAASPGYIIEEMLPVLESTGSLETGTALEHRYYRVTSRAVGGTTSAVVMLQATYKR